MDQFNLKLEDLEILSFEDFRDWHRSQPKKLRDLIQAVAMTMELANVPTAIAFNLAYNLVRMGEIAILERMSGEGPKN